MTSGNLKLQCGISNETRVLVRVVPCWHLICIMCAEKKYDEVHMEYQVASTLLTILVIHCAQYVPLTQLCQIRHS